MDSHLLFRDIIENNAEYFEVWMFCTNCSNVIQFGKFVLWGSFTFLFIAKFLLAWQGLPSSREWAWLAPRPHKPVSPDALQAVFVSPMMPIFRVKRSEALMTHGRFRPTETILLPRCITTVRDATFAFTRILAMAAGIFRWQSAKQ